MQHNYLLIRIDSGELMEFHFLPSCVTHNAFTSVHSFPRFDTPACHLGRTTKNIGR